MPSSIRVIVADDHALFRQGLTSMFDRLHPEVSVVAEVERASEIGPALTRTPCDVLLLDLQMDDHNVLADIPSFARLVQVVVVTASQRPDDALAAVQAGARAIVFKRFAVETLMEALRVVLEGHVWMPPPLQREMTARMIGPGPRTLTSRERQIVRLVGLGFHNPEIAERLCISEVTVKSHLNRVFHKLELRDRVAITRYAIRTGLIGVHDNAE